MAIVKLHRPESIFNDAWLGLGDLNGLEVNNPLICRSPEDIENPGLLEVKSMRSVKNLIFAAKILLDIDLLPVQGAILEELWNSPFPMYIASRGFGKSFLLAVYATLKCILEPGTKVVVVGSAFRQSRIIYEYMDTIWKNAPILRSVCSNESGPRQAVDRCLMVINESSAIFVPLGDGSKIRGLRAHIIIADEFACLRKDSLVETEHGLIRIDDFNQVDHVNVITGDSTCPSEIPQRFIKTPLTDVYRIKLSNGYTIDCSDIHQVMTNNGWKYPNELQEDDYVEQSTQSMHFGNRHFENLDIKTSWLLGTLVSEGSVNDKSLISVTTTDVNTCAKLVNEYGFKFNPVSEYIDKRGWKCKLAYKCWQYNETLRDKLYHLGLDYVTAHNKKIPFTILQSSEEIIQSFLSGLFDGDGSCFLWTDREIDNRLGLAYYSVSERLCRDVHILMYKLGFDGYINNRKSEISPHLQWFVRWNNQTAKIAGTYLNVDRFKDSIMQCSIPEEPTNYCFDKSRNKWKVSIVYCGTTIQQRFHTERQAQDFVDSIKRRIDYRQVVSVEKLPEQEHLYDYYLPKTNSFYAEGHRQHNSIPPDIYETVVRGFAAVSSKPIDNVKEFAKRKALKTHKKWSDKQEATFVSRRTNQCIISGTADYDFMHFTDYWKRYLTIIHANNDIDKPVRLPNGEIKTLREYYPDGIDDSFQSKDYKIVRIPYELVPPGFMDDKVVQAAKSATHRAIYLKEYSACFPADSDGFFKRSLLQSCVALEANPIMLPSGPVTFDASIKGTAGYKYVYGIDPAAENNNFSIVILELHKDHTRIVYGWSTNMKDFESRKKAGTIEENDYYGFCARKIRNLMRVFPTEDIAIDAQGGGRAVLEAFHDPGKLQAGESFLWATNKILDPTKELNTDIEVGSHICHMCQFANFDFTSGANHGTRKDFEDKVLLFPRFDPVSLELAAFQDAAMVKKLGVTKLYDTLEDCVMEIEELKNELSTIVMSRSGHSSGARDRWDTPEGSTADGKKTRLNKDRYSALMMANYIARSIARAPDSPSYSVIGGFAHQLAAQHTHESAKQAMYTGPEWFTAGMTNMGNAIRSIRS